MKNFAKGTVLTLAMALVFNIFSVTGFAVATQLAPPAAPTWDTTVKAKAVWAKDDNATGYSITLYKDTVKLGEAVIIDNKATVEYDFTKVITQTGKYTATVIATGDTTNYTDSEQSPATAVPYDFIAPLKAEYFSIADKVYTGAEQTADVKITAAGTTANITLADVTITGNTATAAGTTEVSIASKDQTKFVGTPVKAGFTITKIPVTVSGVTAPTREYNTNKDVTLDITTATLSGVVEGDKTDVTLVNATGTADKATVGTHPVTIKLTLSGAKAVNYTLTQPTNITVAITQKALVVTGVSPVTTTYGDTAANYTGTPSSTVDRLKYTYKYKGRDTTTYPESETAPKAAGDYTLTVAIDDTNYSGSQAVDFTIAKKILTVNGIVIAEKTYDGTDTANLAKGAVLSLSEGVLPGETVGLDASAVQYLFDNKNAGANKAVTATGGKLTGADAGNYTLEMPSHITGKVNKAVVTVSATATSKVYDGTTTATITVAYASGAVASEESGLTFTGYSGTYNSKDAGDGKTVTIVGTTLGGANAQNYLLSVLPVTATANITQKTVTISPKAITAYAGDNKPAITLEYTGFLTGETMSVITGGSFEGSFASGTTDPLKAADNNTDISVINISTPVAANYTFTKTTAKLKVVNKAAEAANGQAPVTTLPTTPPAKATAVIADAAKTLPSGVQSSDVTLIMLEGKTADEAAARQASSNINKSEPTSFTLKEIDLIYSKAVSGAAIGDSVVLSAPITIAVNAADVGFTNIPSGSAAKVIHLFKNGSVEYITPTISNGVVSFKVSSMSTFAFVVAPPKSLPTPTPIAPPVQEEAPSDQFWSEVHNAIHAKTKPANMVVDAGNRTTMPGAIINDCIAKKVTLNIQWSGGKDVILNYKALKNTSKEMYNLKDLVGKYAKPPVADSQSSDSKEEVKPSPTVKPTPTPKPTPTTMPQESETQETETEPKGTFPWFIVVIIAAIVGAGVFMVVRKKDEEE